MKLWKFTFFILLSILFLLILAAFQIPDSNLHVIACDVGQGDAILAVYKNIQILTDGGPANGKVLDCLSKHLPFWDREIEVVINTHPQLDHYGGLIEVLKRYRVDNFVGNGVDSSAPEYGLLKKMVGSKHITTINPVSGTSIRYNLMSYDIFWPSKDFIKTFEGKPVQNKLGSYISGRDSNNFSIQAILAFGKFRALLTGDIGGEMAADILQNLPTVNINYIKIPHHGSKNGLTQNLLEKIVPGGLPRQNSQQEPSTNSSEKASAKIVGVISVGKNNGYGHPTSEILNLLKSYNIKTYRTDEMGDVELITDGQDFWMK